MADIFDRYGLTRLINVSGKETANGAAQVPPEVLDAVMGVLPQAVDILELQAAASGVIARVTGGEAGFVAGCVAAGICMSVAGCMTGPDMVRVERLPDANGMKNEVLLLKGHNVTYGGRIDQQIALTGARVVEVGTATDVALYQLRGAIGPNTAAAVYVLSHHAVQADMIDLATFCSVCHEAGVPVIVDAANEYDWPGMFAKGADIVIFSAHKAPRAPTAGVVAGREALVRAALFNERGIGRPMKCGKEGIVGAMAALELWARTDFAAERSENRKKLELAERLLSNQRGMSVAIEPDVVDQPVDRLAIRIDAKEAGVSAREVANRLAAGTPKIVIYPLRADLGKLLLDTRNVDEKQLAIVCERICEILRTPSGDLGNTGPRRADRAVEALMRWPHQGRGAKR
ncbi:MAG: aminotransferase class V-fold PLP-dependent enzyme [Alphaproteobacteria bacterium]|nr:aminotransferase class V-fold PLP-dependent enzyme [Alphaproteobacteria bacterium]